MIADKQLVALITPRLVTQGGVTGAAWVDLQGFVASPVSVKAVLMAGQGATPGTCGGYIQAADDTAGTGAVTVATFTTQTSAGGSNEQHFNTVKRYVKFTGTAQTGKSMYVAAALVAQARYTP